MRQPNIDNVEIVEPPIGELTKKHSHLKGACLTSCGSLVALVIGLIIAFHVVVGTGPSIIKTPPANFPGDIPVYDKDTISQIIFIPGKYKKRSLEIAAFFPKIILSSLLLSVQPTPGDQSGEIMVEKAPDESMPKRLWDIVTTPVGDARDTVQIEWQNMDAEPDFVASYYEKELVKNGYLISDQNASNESYQFSFSRGDTIGGAFHAVGNPGDQPGTAFASLTVNFSAGAISTSSTSN